MTDALPTAKPGAFRLRGEPDGVKIKAVMEVGSKSIGSASSNDLIAGVPGITIPTFRRCI